MPGHITERGSNHRSTKIYNRLMVLKMICTQPNITRVDIAKTTGLSKMSVTNIVNDLIIDGYASDNASEIKNNSIGRNPISLEPNLKIYRAIGLYISRDFAIATVTNLKCEVLFETRCEFTSDESKHSFIEKIKSQIQECIGSEKAHGTKILGIGVSCIGPLDIKNGIILDPPNFHHINEIRIKEILEEAFGYTVDIDNDMNASALAEKLYGRGRDFQNFIYLGVTNGIGAGIIANNILFEGATGFSGEVGHMTINFEGPKCACGNTGCLELYAGITQIVKQAAESVSLGFGTSLSEKDKIVWRDIVNSAADGDEFSLSLIDKLSFYISIGIVSLVNLYDPQIIFLGHDIALAGRQVTDKLAQYIKGKALNSRYKDVPVEISSFFERAPVIGSSAIVLNKLFTEYQM